MAKQYIPGVSGLLTEPNPVDAPSNTLTDAENVIVEQGGKVQARHGFNVKESESDVLFIDSSSAIDSTKADTFSTYTEKLTLGTDISKVSDNFNYTVANLFKSEVYVGGTIASQAFTSPTVSTYPTVTDYINNGSTQYYSTVRPYTPSIFTPTFVHRVYTVGSLTAGPSHSVNTTDQLRYISTTVKVNTNNIISSPNTSSTVSDIPYRLTFYVASTNQFQAVPTHNTYWVQLRIPTGYSTQYHSQFVYMYYDYSTNTTSATIQAAEANQSPYGPPYKIDIIDAKHTRYPQSRYNSSSSQPYETVYWTKIELTFKVNVSLNVDTDLELRVYPRSKDAYPAEPYYSAGIGFNYYRKMSANITRIYYVGSNPTIQTYINFIKPGDSITFKSGALLPGLSLRAYTVKDSVSAVQYIEFEHPNQTISDSQPFDTYIPYSSSIISPTTFQIGDITLRQVFSEGKYRDNTYSYNPSYPIYANSWVLGTTTKLYYTSNTAYTGDSYDNFIRFINGNVPTGIELNKDYRCLGSGYDYISGSYKAYIIIDVATSGAIPSGNVELIRGIWRQIYSANSATATDSIYAPSYVYTSQFNINLPFLKLLTYKKSNDSNDVILFVKQTLNSYALNNTGIFKTNSNTVINRYYLINDDGNLGKYQTLPYTSVQNAFTTKESLYLQTENGLAEANVDDIDQDINNKFFDISWPAFPEISYVLKQSSVVQNWLKAGTKCSVRMTFYREMGYTDKPNTIYESEPSVPILVSSPVKNTIPEFYIDFRTIFDSTNIYQKYNAFIKANRGRKFGIRLYRTSVVDLNENIPDEYFQCYADLPFEKFMAGSLYQSDARTIDISNDSFAIRESLSSYPTSTGGSATNSNPTDLELNIGDVVSVIYDSTQEPTSYYRLASTDRPPVYPVWVGFLTGSSTITIQSISGGGAAISNPFEVGDVVYFANSDAEFSSSNVAFYVVSASDSTQSLSGAWIKVAYSPNGAAITYTGSGITIGASIYAPKFTKYTTSPETSRNINYPLLPSKYNTTDKDILKNDYNPARLKVINKKSFTDGTNHLYYIYKFSLVDSIYNDRYSSNPALGYLKYNTVITKNHFTRLVTNYNSDPTYGEYTNKIGIMRSFIATLEINDDGIKSLPQLYTNINKDGAANSNILLPKASSAIRYKDFYIYYGITKSLTTNIFVTSQPKVESIYFHHYAYISPNVGWVGNQPSSYLFYFPTQNISFPTVGETADSLTNTNGRIFIDAPFCGTQDLEVVRFNNANVTVGNAVANQIQFKQNSIISPTITYRNNTWTSLFYQNQNLFNTYRFNATMYEQAKLTLRLTSMSDQVNVISIKTYPFYNRKGYYNKYTTKGILDNNALSFDYSLNEANGVQLSKYTELVMRQSMNAGKQSIVVNADSPIYGKDIYLDESLSTIMGNGIFNIVGSKDGEYQSDGRVKGFTTTEATTGRGLFWDETNGKIVIRTDSTYGSTSNKFDLKKFESPGYIIIQYKKSTDGVGITTDWDSKLTAIYSYTNISQRSNGIYDIIGAKPVNSSLSVLKLNYGSIHSDVIIDLFFLSSTAIDNIPLYAYSDAPVIRSYSIDLTTAGASNYFGAVLKEYVPAPQMLYGRPTPGDGEISNSPQQPFFTFHPHTNRSDIPIAVLSSSGNHKFIGSLAGYAKSNAELLDEYTYSIIEGFNKEFREKDIPAVLRKGQNIGEFIVDYPDGKKIEIRNEYGSHQFYPSINTVSSNTSQGGYITLAERTNNEYKEKNKIQWSRRNIPEITTNLLYSYLGKNDKDIIGIAANADDVYVFKEDGIYRCTDSGSLNGFDLPVLSSFIFSNTFICQGSDSIQEINDEIIFLSQYGFMSIINGGIQNISTAIERDILDLLSVTPKDRIKSFVNKSKNLYYCTLINEVDPLLNVKSGTYIFNTKTRQWSFMDEEVLTGIEDVNFKNITVYRQRPVKGKLLNRVNTQDGSKPIFNFTDLAVVDSVNRLIRYQESTPLDMFYTTREQFTNNIRNNSIDQYDFSTQSRYEGNVSMWIKKSGDNEFYIKTEQILPNTIFRNKFRSSVEHALVSNYSDNPAIGTIMPVVDSFVTLFANRTIYLQKNNSSSDLYQVRLKKTDLDDFNMYVYFEFVDTPPTWFTSMSTGFFNTGSGSSYKIIAGIPVKITFNPESGRSPDTNKLFQEYMIHTETMNKGALMSFKTDSRSLFTTDRRFVFDAATTNRNVFRTYIPTSAARGRYLIRQIKHDVPLENLIITGQTIVIRDTASTRVQKDKDDN